MFTGGPPVFGVSCDAAIPHVKRQRTTAVTKELTHGFFILSPFYF
jgi:hypothetical protein